jgi:hypothetical protein
MGCDDTHYLSYKYLFPKQKILKKFFSGKCRRQIVVKKKKNRAAHIYFLKFLWRRKPKRALHGWNRKYAL